MTKVFCIGLHKTGTTSLCASAELLGLRAYHSTDWSTFDQTGSCSPVLRHYDFFADGGAHFWPGPGEPDMNHHFEALEYLFPEARFVLNVRQFGDWLVSKASHAGWNGGTEFSRSMIQSSHEQWRTPSWGNVRGFALNWVKYHHAVMTHFAQSPSTRFLVIDFVGNPLSLKDLAEFMDVDTASSDLNSAQRPWKNATKVSDDRRNSMKVALTSILSKSDGELFDEVKEVSHRLGLPGVALFL